MFKILKVGADVELFLRHNTGALVSAVGMIGGTKRHPRPIDDKGSALQEDNVMLEFNVIPSINEEEFRNNINKVLIHIFEELKEKDLVADISSSHRFPHQLLDTEQARTMGCDPDWSAWTIQQNNLLSPELLGNLRTSGGHVHVSFMVDDKNPKNVHKYNFIRMLDLALGVPSILLDDDNERRKYYGKPGAFRNKGSNHIEYRTLSNFWIKNDSLKEWVFNNVSWACKELNSRGDSVKTDLWGEQLENQITKCIEFSNVPLAEELVEKHQVPMPK